MSDEEGSAYSFKPASKKQWSFLKSEAQIVVYGGERCASIQHLLKR